ncbi:MAG: BREX-4 system phosphatase PglZ [Lachnospiraceae bacterium]|nr:BREX-4 system phosphatase PglZ [Lachnospiraceae bacterium]
MLCPEIDRYLDKAKGLPFFYAVGDKEYMSILNELSQNGFQMIRTSGFCHKDDKFPDIDEIVDYFHTLDVDYKSNRFVLVGLGEYLALKGSDEAKKTLRRLKNTTLGNARVVILLRGIAVQIRELVNEDDRLVEKNLVCFSENAVSNITVTNNKIKNTTEQKSGVKQLIRIFEDGATGDVVMDSMLSFDNALVPIVVIDKAYTALSKTCLGLSLEEQYGNDEQWTKLLDDYSKNPDDVQKYFSTYANHENDIYEYVLGDGYKNWLYFLNLKVNKDTIQNRYLSFVVNRTNDFRGLRENLLNGITKVSYGDRNFKELYEGRKALVKNFPESDIAIFIKENKIEPTEEIYKYTDNTVLERRQIISWVAKNGWNDIIAEIYPALGMYLKKYIFDCGSVSQELTDYFEKYKLLKVENRIDDKFIQLVYTYGKNYIYTKLQTRDTAINKIENKSTTYLYWIDALGVEHLSYILALANKKGLSIHIDIARADLPTITSVNKRFFEEWNGVKKYKEEELDEIKHKEKGGFFYEDGQEPFHLVTELDIIKRTIDNAAISLAMHECRQFVIASDHGASRLAVIKKDEKKHPTDTKGEHSGRCCKAYDENDREFVIEENGYFVRTDYGRYKGSRAANVEVHGGASLEEIVVPIITLKLKKQLDVDIRVLNEDKLQADRHNGVLVELYISDVDNINNVYLMIDGNKYIAKSNDKNHYSVLLADIKRQKECKADVYDGEDLIGTVSLVVKGKVANINNDFDDLF